MAQPIPHLPLQLSRPSSEPTASRRRPPWTLATGVVHLILLVLAAICLLPFIWLICSTLKSNQDFAGTIFLPWDHPERISLDNYRQLFARQPFGLWLLNSLFITSLHTALVVSLSSLGGFALAKYRFRGRKLLMAVMLVTLLLPSQVILPSAWLLIHKFGWLDSYKAVIVPSAVSVFGMFLFMQAMKNVPDELLQAGRIDGCSELRLWWNVALPIVRPMVGAYTLLSFMSTWNSFLWPQIVLQSPRKYTIPIGLSNMIGLPSDQVAYGMLMAGTLLAILPVVVLFFVLQKDFINGLASGAVKG